MMLSCAAVQCIIVVRAFSPARFQMAATPDGYLCVCPAEYNVALRLVQDGYVDAREAVESGKVAGSMVLKPRNCFGHESKCGLAMK